MNLINEIIDAVCFDNIKFSLDFQDTVYQPFYKAKMKNNHLERDNDFLKQNIKFKDFIADFSERATLEFETEYARQSDFIYVFASYKERHYCLLLDGGDGRLKLEVHQYHKNFIIYKEGKEYASFENMSEIRSFMANEIKCSNFDFTNLDEILSTIKDKYEIKSILSIISNNGYTS